MEGVRNKGRTVRNANFRQGSTRLLLPSRYSDRLADEDAEIYGIHS